MSLPKGTKVLFGRSHGEQTLGEIVKVNPSTYKVKQLESRGTMKSHSVGTIWTVPHPLATEAPAGTVVPTPAPTVVTPTAPSASDPRAAALWNAPRFGLPADAIGKTFTSGGTTFRITGIATNRPKFPVSAVRVRDERGFKFTADTVVRGLGGVAAPKPTYTPASTLRFKVGDRVEFSSTKRGRTTVIAGTVKTVNVKTITLVDTSDGHPVGWRVTPGMLRPSTIPAPVKAPTPALPSGIRPGGPVTFEAFSWAAKTLAPVTGVVTLIDPAKGEVEVFSGQTPRRTQRLTFADVTAAPKRTEDDILDDFCAVHMALEPENLTCDGERSRTEVNRARAALERALRALTSELGRYVDSSESFAREMRKNGRPEMTSSLGG